MEEISKYDPNRHTHWVRSVDKKEWSMGTRTTVTFIIWTQQQLLETFKPSEIMERLPATKAWIEPIVKDNMTEGDEAFITYL